MKNSYSSATKTPEEKIKSLKLQNATLIRFIREINRVSNLDSDTGFWMKEIKKLSEKALFLSDEDA